MARGSARRPKPQQPKHKPTQPQNHNNPKTNQPNPGRQPGHPVLLPQTKEGRQSGVKSAVQPWQPGRHAGKGTRRGPNPTNKNHTTRKHASPPANNQAVPRHANQSDAVKHKLKKLAAAQGRSSMRNCEGRSSTPVRLEAEPTVDALKIERGFVPWQRRQR